MLRNLKTLTSGLVLGMTLTMAMNEIAFQKLLPPLFWFVLIFLATMNIVLWFAYLLKQDSQ